MSIFSSIKSGISKAVSAVKSAFSQPYSSPGSSFAKSPASSYSGTTSRTTPTGIPLAPTTNTGKTSTPVASNPGFSAQSNMTRSNMPGGEPDEIGWSPEYIQAARDRAMGNKNISVGAGGAALTTDEISPQDVKTQDKTKTPFMAPVNPIYQTGTYQPTQAQNQQSNQQIADTMKKAHQTLKESGVQSPIDNATGMAAASTAAKEQERVSNAGKDAIPEGGKNLVSSLFGGQDQTWNQYADNYKYITSTYAQKQSLVDSYNQLIKDSGIKAIDTQLLDMKKVIDGTEDDIRNEVTKAGGFATDSQVLALTNARNTQLVKNYNNLLETRNNMMDYIDKTMGFEQKDREYAIQEMDRQLGFEDKRLQHGIQMQDNARQSLQKVADTLGYGALLQETGGNQYYVNMIEKTLGLAPGGLAQMATYKKPLTEKEQLEIQKLRNEVYGTGGLDEKTLGKIQSSNEYRTINSILPAIQTLKDYKEAINKYGTGERFSGTGKGELSGTYGNALAAWKTLAGLGALSGADFALAENAVPSVGFFRRAGTSLGKINSSLDTAVKQAENLTRRLYQNYPSANSLLNQQLDDIRLTAYPEKYTRGPDGLVYEIQ